MIITVFNHFVLCLNHSFILDLYLIFLSNIFFNYYNMKLENFTRNDFIKFTNMGKVNTMPLTSMDERRNEKKK